MEMRFLGNFHHGAVAHGADPLTSNDRYANGNLFGQVGGEILINGQAVGGVRDGNAFAHHRVVPDACDRAVGGGKDGSVGGGGKVNAEVNAVVLHGAGEHLQIGAVRLKQGTVHGQRKRRHGFNGRRGVGLLLGRVGCGFGRGVGFDDGLIRRL